MKKIIFFLIFFTSSHHNSYGQFFTIKNQIQCSCSIQDCDTIKTDIFDSSGMKICSFEKDSLFNSSTFFYSMKHLLIRKNIFDENGVFLSFIASYYDSKNEWFADSSFDRNNKLLFTKILQKDSTPNLSVIQFRNFATKQPYYIQKILKDDQNNEVANTICYELQTCITKKTNYNNGVISTIETWVFSNANPLPVLSETESYIYNEERKLTMSVIKKGEKEECTYFIYFK